MKKAVFFTLLVGMFTALSMMSFATGPSIVYESDHVPKVSNTITPSSIIDAFNLWYGKGAIVQTESTYGECTVVNYMTESSAASYIQAARACYFIDDEDIVQGWVPMDATGALCYRVSITVQYNGPCKNVNIPRPDQSCN